MPSLVQQSTTQLALKFFLVLSSDHISPATGLSPTVTIRKEGGSFGSPSGAVSEVANGWYQVAGNATDTNTLGEVLLHASVATADNCDMIAAQVVAFNPQNANLGLSNVSANVNQINGVSAAPVTTINANIGETQPINFTGSAASALVQVDLKDIAGSAVSTASAQLGVNVVQVNGVSTSAVANVNANIGTTNVLSVDSNGNVSSTSNVKKNVASSGFMFVMTNATTGAPMTGLTVTSQRALDGGVFNNCVNSATEVAVGWYTINLAAADLNGNHIALRFTATGANDTDIELLTQP